MSLLIALPLVLCTSLFWMWLIARHDDHEREPWPLVLLAACIGAASGFGVLWTRPLLEEALHPVSTMLEAFIVTALAEESWKLAALLPLLLLTEVDEPLDGAIYGVAVGLGFATLENLVVARSVDDIGVLLQRCATASLMHVAATGCLGLSFAEAKLRPRGVATVAWIALGLFVAIGAHGSYDLFLGGGRAQALLSLLVVLPLAVTLLSMKVYWARSRSHHFHPRG